MSALFPASTGVHGGPTALLRSTQSRVQEGPQHGLYLAHPGACPGMGLQPPKEGKMLSSDLPFTPGAYGPVKAPLPAAPLH